MTDDVYTHGHHESVLRSHTWRTVANSAGYLVPHLVAGASMLDVGCGPGTLTAEFGQRLAPGTVLGIDVAADVLEQAAAHAAAVGVDNVTFAPGSVYALDHPDDSFDIVHAHQVLQHVSDPVAALAEMRRVCAPDGIVAVRDADYQAMAWYPELPDLDRWLDVYRQVARRNDAEPDAGRHLLAWANQVGFESVSTSADVWCFADVADREWWGSLWADRVRQSSLASQAVEYGIATTHDLASFAAAFDQWRVDPDGWFAVVNTELICRG